MLDLSPGVPVVTAAIDGQPVRLILDTGATRSVLDEAAVARLGVPLDEWAAMTMRGVGGAVRHRVARLRTLTLGGAALRRRSAAGDMSIAVVPGLPLSPDAAVSGLLGAEYLSGYDLEWDGRTARLHEVAGCSGRFLPWTGPYDALAAEPAVPGWFVVTVAVGKTRLRALLDTGAEHSVLLPRGAAATGLRAGGRERAGIAGIGPGEIAAEIVTLAEVRIGSETIRAMPLLLTRDVGVPGIDMIFGLDWIGPRRVWLSNATGQVFVGRP